MKRTLTAVLLLVLVSLAVAGIASAEHGGQLPWTHVTTMHTQAK